MTNPKLTIVSLAYNQEKFIAEALESFIMQKTNFDFEVIISDDCSTDNTAKIIKEYAEKYPEIIKPIYREKNLGVNENYIDTLSKAESEYLIYCEGDDYFTDPLKLQKQVDFLDSHPEFSICFHPVRFFYEDNSCSDEIFPSSKVRLHKKVLDLEDLLIRNFIQTNSCVYRWRFNGNEKIKDIFPKNILPLDWFLHMLHAQKGKIGFINEVMSDYRRHKDGIWWKSSKSLEELHLEYGIEELNFYIAVEKIIAKDKEEYHKISLLHAKSLIPIYLKHKNFGDLEKLLNLCPDVIGLDNLGQNSYFLDRKIKILRKRNLFLIILSTVISVLFLISIFLNVL